MQQTKKERKQTKHNWYMRNRITCIDRQKEYRQNHKDKIKHYDKKHSKILYTKHKNMLDKIKRVNGCIICGQTEGVLDFHHISPTDKLFNITSARHKTNTELINEINKCIVVCRSCHIRIHLDDRAHDKITKCRYCRQTIYSRSNNSIL